MSWCGHGEAGWAKPPVGSACVFGFLGCIHRAHSRLGQAGLLGVTASPFVTVRGL